MESRVLDFVDAMRLAQILGKYIDTEATRNQTGEEFITELFPKMEIDEIITISELLLSDSITNIEPSRVMEVCTDGLIKNNILDLLAAYKQIGFA